MTNDRIIPDAPCFLVGKPCIPKHDDLGSSMHWKVTLCPLCGEKNAHLHGAGNNPEEARRDFLGNRGAHCFGGSSSDSGYNLVEAIPEG